MAINLFMKVEGADGECANAKHKNWVDIDSFSWGASQESTMHVGGGGGAGKVTFQNLTVVAPVDKAYPTMLIKCASGDHISNVKIVGCKAGGDELEYYKITLEDVMVTGVNVTGSEGAQVIVSYSFQAAKVKTEYTVQTEKGGKGATSEFGWDIKKNTKT
jgi:type VI secretion system secreted protein Hcp